MKTWVRKSWEFISLPFILSAALWSTVKFTEQPSWSLWGRDEHEAGTRGRAEADKGGERASSSDTTRGACWKPRSLVGLRNVWDWRGLKKQVGRKRGMTLSFYSGKKYGAINTF